MRDKEYNELRQLLRKGMTYRDIANEMGIPESVVRKADKMAKEERNSGKTNLR